MTSRMTFYVIPHSPWQMIISTVNYTRAFITLLSKSPAAVVSRVAGPFPRCTLQRLVVSEHEARRFAGDRGGGGGVKEGTEHCMECEL